MGTLGTIALALALSALFFVWALTVLLCHVIFAVLAEIFPGYFWRVSYVKRCLVTIFSPLAIGWDILGDVFYAVSRRLGRSS